MFKRILPYIITAVIGIAITVAIICSKQIWAADGTKIVMQILSDALFVPGVLLAGVGLIIFASNGGAFDMLGFAVLLFFNLFRKDVNKRKYKDFYEYRQAKKDKKRSMAFMLITGLIFIAIAVIFIIVYANV